MIKKITVIKKKSITKQLPRAKELNNKSTPKGKKILPITIQKLPKIKNDKLTLIKEKQISKTKKKSLIKKSISNTTSALTVKTENTIPSTITEIFATYYMYVINETQHKIPEPLELSIVKDLLFKLFAKEKQKYTSISEYLIAKGKQQRIAIKEITNEDFRKFILKLSTIEETEWVKVIPENNLEHLLIKLLKIKR
jgi:hypothetical protein